MKATPGRSGSLLCALLAAALVTACGGDSPEQLMASAKSYLEKREPRAATIQLKTALQARPDWAEARFLLGKALLQGEEPVLAAVELRKALELKHRADEVVPLLAQAMLQQGQHKQVIAEFGATSLDDKAALADLKTTLGWAYLAGGQPAEADAALTQALEAAPGHTPAQVARVRRLAAAGDRDGALKAVEALLAAHAGDADAWALKGDLLAASRADVDGAIAAYRRSIELDNTKVGAHAGAIALHLSRRDVAAAGTQLTELQKLRPSHPTTRFFQAQLAFEKAEYKVAKEIVAELLKASPDHPMLNQLAGAAELSLGAHVQARNHLGKTLQAAPGAVVARRMLAASYLRTGETAQALTVLEPLLSIASPDAVALALAGEAHLQAGDLDKASERLAASVKAAPNPNNRVALARTRLLQGDAVGAVADLQQIAATETGSVADLELVNAHLRKRDYKAALAAVDALERKEAGKPLPPHLRGVAYAGLNDTAQARASFEKALAIDPAYFASVAALAALDLQDKKPQVAEQRFEALLKKQPGHLQAMLGIAQVRARSGAPAEQVTQALSEAVRLNPSQPAAHLALINHQLAAKSNEAALGAAQRADAALPNQPAILDALGRAQIAAGQTNQAISTFNRLAGLQPDRATAHVRMSDANLAAKDVDAAIRNLKRAVAIKPDSPALLRLFALHLQAGQHKEAQALARGLQQRQPTHGIGYVLEGDALRAAKNNDAALAAYRRGLTKEQPATSAMRVHSMLADGGKAAEADQFGQGWLKEHPKDVAFAVYLGDRALSRGELAASEAAYRRVLDVQPSNVIALNNVAWLMAKGNKPGALAYAQKANELQPNQPTLMDTLAFALAADKQVDKALELQKKALELAPESPVMKLGLARLYVQAGQKAQARELLEPLSQLGDKFRDQAEVKSLLATL